MAKGGLTVSRVSPFERVTLSKVPENKTRERTSYGWEGLEKPKQSYRVPATMLKNARVSLFQHQAKMRAAWKSRKEAAEKEGKEFTEKQPSFTTYPATDDKGRFLCASKSNPMVAVPQDDPDAMPNELNKRSKPVPAFYEFVRMA